jgi:hypothetical protein
MAKKFPLHPAHPERTCWGCDLYCAADSMRCGNGSERTQHPVELFGDDWASFGLDAQAPAGDAGAAAPADAAAGTLAAEARAPSIRVERTAAVAAPTAATPAPLRTPR